MDGHTGPLFQPAQSQQASVLPLHRGLCVPLTPLACRTGTAACPCFQHTSESVLDQRMARLTQIDADYGFFSLFFTGELRRVLNFQIIQLNHTVKDENLDSNIYIYIYIYGKKKRRIHQVLPQEEFRA